MFALIGMLRPFNCLMACIGVFIGWLVTSGFAIFSPMLFLAAVIAFLITGAGNVINDYIDVESDRVNRPKRPIPSGKVSKDVAFAFAVALFMAGIVLSLFISLPVFMLAVINSVLLVLYSMTLQDKLMLGNMTVGYLAGSVFLFGGLAANNPGRILSPVTLFLLAMLSTISREIVKDLEDVEGDKLGFLKRITHKVTKKIADRFRLGKQGVELKLGNDAMIVIAITLLGIAVVLSFIPYYYDMFSAWYLFVVLIADAVFLDCIYLLGRRNKSRYYAKISRRMKLGMLIAMLAFIAGVLV
jgi:geranylgeranylglycerol-phosphate geranylgeranyltransferase